MASAAWVPPRSTEPWLPLTIWNTMGTSQCPSVGRAMAPPWALRGPSRHGQSASQLQFSRYSPSMRHDSAMMFTSEVRAMPTPRSAAASGRVTAFYRGTPAGARRQGVSVWPVPPDPGRSTLRRSHRIAMTWAARFDVLIHAPLYAALRTLSPDARARFRRLVDRLRAGQWSGGTRVKKLRGCPKPVFEARQDAGDRILFTLAHTAARDVAETLRPHLQLWDLVHHDRVAGRGRSSRPRGDHGRRPLVRGPRALARGRRAMAGADGPGRGGAGAQADRGAVRGGAGPGSRAAVRQRGERKDHDRRPSAGGGGGRGPERSRALPHLQRLAARPCPRSVPRPAR